MTKATPITTALHELQAAHQIIRNALNLMTAEQKNAWAGLNAASQCDGEGTTRANEREAIISMLASHIEMTGTARGRHE